MRDVLTIREAVRRSNDEGVPVSEYALRRWVKTGAIPTRQAGTKTLIYFPRLVEFLTCAGGCDARNFTTLPNELLQDPRLSCGDLGLLVQMLSRPENWDFSTSSLTALYAGRAGKESLARSVKRLKELGYLTIERKRTPGGKLGSAVWTVFDEPQPGKPECGSPQPGKPDSGFPPPYKIQSIQNLQSPLRGGLEREPEFFLDPETRGWKRRGTA